MFHVAFYFIFEIRKIVQIMARASCRIFFLEKKEECEKRIFLTALVRLRRINTRSRISNFFFTAIIIIITRRSCCVSRENLRKVGHFSTFVSQINGRGAGARAMKEKEKEESVAITREELVEGCCYCCWLCCIGYLFYFFSSYRRRHSFPITQRAKEAAVTAESGKPAGT
jgi:hypothetical protein